MPNISIIVPVYNREKDLPALIESILSCADPRFELLLVNDGSKDNSLSVCQEFAARDKRVQVIDKENGGVSTARNAGIEQAKGKYLFFCDSDDLVVTETFASALDLVETHDEDLLVFDFEYCFLNNGTTRKSSFVLPPDRPLSKEEIVSGMIEPLVCKEGTDLAGVWHKLFRADLVKSNHLRFEEKVARGEDWRFILDCLDAANSAFYIPSVLYIYKIDGSQVPSKYKRTPGIHLLGSIDRKLRLIEKYGIPISEEEKLRLRKSYIAEIAYAAAYDCPRQELLSMMRSPLVQESIRILRALPREQKNKIEFFRRGKLFSFCIKHNLVFPARIAAKRWYKHKS